VGAAYDEQFRYLFGGVVRQLATFLPLEMSMAFFFFFLFFFLFFSLTSMRFGSELPNSADLATAYHDGSDEDEKFIQDLGLFFCGFLKEHLRLVETPELRELLVRAHQYLLNISEVDDREVFKSCLEYWSKLVSFHPWQPLDSIMPTLSVFVRLQSSIPKVPSVRLP